MKNLIDNISNLKSVNDIMRKIKLVKIILDNLITENTKILEEIQNTMNNNENIIKKNNDYNIEIFGKNGLKSNEENLIKTFIVKAVEQYSDFGDISLNILDKCNNLEKGG